MDVDGMGMDDDPADLARVSEAIKTLYYEDVIFVLLPNATSIRDILAMKVNLQYTEGHHKKKRSGK
jgi:hypothetical protein